MESGATSASVNYDDTPIAQAQIAGADYRVDAGLGTRVAISTRAEGTWDWSLLAEGKWDGLRLRARGLGHDVLAPLGEALARAMSEEEGCS